MTSLPCIVVGVDHTPSGTAALRWAADEARRTGARVRAIHVWRCSDAAEHQRVPGVEREEVHQNATRWIVDALTRVGSDIDVSVELLDGDPGPALVTAAKGAALLVLGANTFTPAGLPDSPLIEYCVSTSPCRLVVVDGHDRRASVPPTAGQASAGVSTP